MDFLKFDYLKYAKCYIAISVFLLIFSFFFLFFWKKNLSIDMTWWINLEYWYTKELSIDKIREDFEKQKDLVVYNWEKVINNINIYWTNWEKKISVIAWFIDVSDEKKMDELKWEFRKKALEIVKSSDDTAKELNYTNIWKTFWDYIKSTAYLTLSLAIIWMFFYVFYAFSGSVSGISWFSFWFVSLLTLFHDVVVAAWIYIFIWDFYPDFQVDIYFITALLTILWYSINDTIVIFDRIRENLKVYGWKKWKDWKTLYEIVNLSVLETFKRSLFTSLTLVFVLITIFVFGPESLKWFIFVMLVWTIVWTYSSIFLASPIFYEMNKNKELSIYKKKVYNPDDKLVV